MIQNDPSNEIPELDSGERVIGTGVDIVENSRFDPDQNSLTDRSRERMFTPMELATANNRRHQDRYLAGRFALKEATIKSLPTPDVTLLDMAEIEVRTETDGAPSVRLPSSVPSKYDVRGSISHETDHTVGFVIAVDTDITKPEAE